MILTVPIPTVVQDEVALRYAAYMCAWVQWRRWPLWMRKVRPTPWRARMAESIINHWVEDDIKDALMRVAESTLQVHRPDACQKTESYSGRS